MRGRNPAWWGRDSDIPEGWWLMNFSKVSEPHESSLHLQQLTTSHKTPYQTTAWGHRTARLHPNNNKSNTRTVWKWTAAPLPLQRKTHLHQSDHQWRQQDNWICALYFCPQLDCWCYISVILVDKRPNISDHVQLFFLFFFITTRKCVSQWKSNTRKINHRKEIYLSRAASIDHSACGHKSSCAVWEIVTQIGYGSTGFTQK